VSELTQPELASGAAPGSASAPEAGFDLQAVRTWVRQRQMPLAGVALIAVTLAWRIQFLSHMYFRLDDFLDLDRAIESPFTWKYVTFNGVGHLIIGLRALAWVLVRTSLYNYPLDTAIDLVLVGLAGLAALRLLRSLFGDRPAILVPLAIYMFCPLTIPALGEWSSALEALPLQIAIFMALDAHVRYLRTGLRRHFAAAMFWIGFGLLFFEKALLIPVLLFGVTSAYFAGETSWLAGMRRTLARYKYQWAGYAALMAVFIVVLAKSLATSSAQPAAPRSTGAALKVTWGLIGRTFVPGAFGGPWSWLSDGTFALAATALGLVVVTTVAAVAVIGFSIWFRRSAWRAWAILAGWLLVADVLPIVVGRVNIYFLDVLATETRYVADAVPVLAICVGLAFLPLSGREAAPAAVPGSGRVHARPGHGRQLAASFLVGVFIIGSIWSAQAYEADTSGSVASAYVHNATQALELAPAGTTVVDGPVPAAIVVHHNGSPVAASELIGDMQRNGLGKPLTWVSRPHGNVGNLMIFGTDGRLYHMWIVGAASVHRKGTGWRGCWPDRHGRIVVHLLAPSPSDSTELSIGYLWGGLPTTATVSYGATAQSLAIRHGLNNAYLPISGSARQVEIDVGVPGLCIGPVSAGAMAANPLLASLPLR